MIYRDPTHELLKAYVNVLSGSIIWNGSPVAVGTKIPQGETEYVLIYVEDINNMSTGDGPIYNATVAMQAVSLQDVNEGDETPVNRIIEQIIEVISDPEMFIMNNFKCVMAMPEGITPDTELTESSYNVLRTLRMSNIVEQIK